ncbi:14470_t:CDS:1 [Ambispora leptoticha]|uniref:14470_t:CDS:1 n=1 Tax=Ambispora leptoticha TaxID=144679 RepID=A0A9N9GT37_9GLOM|nr:14470_t:CDS:1 [Ambispora leptoticha]
MSTVWNIDDLDVANFEVPFPPGQSVEEFTPKENGEMVTKCNKFFIYRSYVNKLLKSRGIKLNGGGQKLSTFATRLWAKEPENQKKYYGKIAKKLQKTYSKRISKNNEQESTKLIGSQSVDQQIAHQQINQQTDQQINQQADQQINQQTDQKINHQQIVQQEFMYSPSYYSYEDWKSIWKIEYQLMDLQNSSTPPF